MNIKLIRTATFLLVSVLMLACGYNYLWYIAAMHLSLEILNRQTAYLQHRYRIYNFIFWSYELVLLERLRTSFFSEQTEWLLNSAEHLAFGIIICIKVYIYTAVFSKASVPVRWKRALAAFVIFNIIGLINEIFQNNLAHRSLIIFIADSMKDMKMNLLGAGIFLIAVALRIQWLKKMRRCLPVF